MLSGHAHVNYQLTLSLSISDLAAMNVSVM